jgi:putative acetyltransferase
MITVRPEQAQDVEAVRRVNEQAFETPAEARLVDLLRARGKLVASLVAQAGDQVVGHIAFSPVGIASNPELRGVGLGPMAVLPAMQKQGIGTALVHAGLDSCRDIGYDYAVVVGHPEYYPRFGFVPASRFGIRCTWKLPEGVFMALELRAQALAGSGGIAMYEPEFYEV